MFAEGRKPRLRKAPPIRPREVKLHTDVAKVLRDHCLPDWLWWHTPNGERRDVQTGARLKRMGVKPGVPDFLLISPYGSVRFLELKRIGETLSETQEEFRIFCIRQGIPHAIAWTFDEALTAHDHWGCLRIKIGGGR
jgi:hypothetical protein